MFHTGIEDSAIAVPYLPGDCDTVAFFFSKQSFRTRTFFVLHYLSLKVQSVVVSTESRLVQLKSAVFVYWMVQNDRKKFIYQYIKMFHFD